MPIVALVVLLQVGAHVVQQRRPSQQARKLVSQGQLHWQVGQLEDAAEALEAAAALAPDDGQITVLLARLRQAQGRADEAERLLRAAVSRRPQDPLVVVPLARLLLDMGQPLEAAEVLEPELATIRKVTDPVQRIDALLVAARAATARGALLQAEALLRESTRVGPAPVTSVAKAAAEACLALADLLTRSGRLAAARDALDGARTYTSWDPRIALGYARVLELAGQTDEAIAQLSPLVTTPDGPDLRAAEALGAVLIRARRTEDVAVLVSQVEASLAGRELAGALRAAVALDHGDDARAMAEAARFLETHPTSPAALLAQGRAALASGVLEVARASFEAALASSPRSTEAALALLEVDERAGDPAFIRARALELLARPDTRVWGLRALVCVAVRDPGALTAARERLEGLSASRPSDAALRVHLGLMRLGTGDSERAAADLQPLLGAADLAGASSMLADTPEGMLQGITAVEGLAVLLLRPAEGDASTCRLLAARALERLDRQGLASALLAGETGHEAAILRVQLAVRARALEQAVSVLEALRATEPEDQAVLAALGELRLLRGDMAKARELLEQAARANPDSAALQARLGRARVGVGDLAGAAEAYAAARALDGRLAIAHEDAVLAVRADAATALTRLRAGLEATGDARFGFAQAAVEGVAGAPREALQTLQRSGAGDAGGHLLVTALLAEAGEVERARGAARTGAAPPVVKAAALQSKAGGRRALWTLVALATLDWWAEARTAAEEIVVDPQADALSLWWAWRTFEQRDVALAVRLGERVAGLAPDDVEVTLLLAAARHAAGDRAGDARLVKGVQEAGLKEPGLLFELGMALERVGDRDAAERCYRDAQTRGLRDAGISNNLAWLLASGGSAEGRREALLHAREAVRLAPTSAEVLDTLAWIQHLLGDDHEAAPLAERAAARLPGNATIRFHLAEVLAALGRTDQARLVLEGALRLHGSWPEVAEARARLDALGPVAR